MASILSMSSSKAEEGRTSYKRRRDINIVTSTTLIHFTYLPSLRKWPSTQSPCLQSKYCDSMCEWFAVVFITNGWKRSLIQARKTLIHINKPKSRPHGFTYLVMLPSKTPPIRESPAEKLFKQFQQKKT